MTFSDGQLNFAIAFFVLFVMVMIFAYQSDIQKLASKDTGALKVLVFIGTTLMVFYAIVKFLAH